MLIIILLFKFMFLSLHQNFEVFINLNRITSMLNDVRLYDLQLIRYFIRSVGVYGILKILDSSSNVFRTCENLNYLIPDGEYEYYFAFSPKYRRFMPYVDVPARNGIMFHAGNYPQESLGCILVGEDIAFDSMLTNSRKAFDKFFDYVYMPIVGVSFKRGHISVKTDLNLPF